MGKLAICMAVVCAIGMSAVAAAATPPEIAAEQIQVQNPQNTIIGGPGNQRMAQVFRMHWAGTVSHLMLPISCPANVVVRVTIEASTAGVPNGQVLALQDVPGHVLDGYVWSSGAGMRMVEFARPARLQPGEYAFTVSMLTQNKFKPSCTFWTGPVGETYGYGRGFFMASFNGPAWVELFDASGATRDLAFQVYARPN